MELSVSEKLRLIMARKKIKVGDLADATNQSRQNLSNKLTRDNFTVNEAQKMAEALGCKLSVVFTDLETGEMY